MNPWLGGADPARPGPGPKSLHRLVMETLQAQFQAVLACLAPVHKVERLPRDTLSVTGPIGKIKITCMVGWATAENALHFGPAKNSRTDIYIYVNSKCIWHPFLFCSPQGSCLLSPMSCVRS